MIDDRGLLGEIGRAHPNAPMAAGAPLGILVCGDRSLELSEGYWPVDCAAAAENLLLAAHALGLGAVWTGVYPRGPRMVEFGDRQKQIVYCRDPEGNLLELCDYR